MNGIDTPAFAGAAIVTCHAPTQYGSAEGRHVHDSRDKALRVAAPRLTTCNRAAPINSDCSVVTARNKAATRGQNVLERIATVGADLQDATTKPTL